MTSSLTHYHAVLLDETGCEFGAGCDARSKDEARMILANDYPESRIVQIESPQDEAKRVSAMHRHIALGGDWDDEGRPIFHHPEEDDEDDMYADDDLDDEDEDEDSLANTFVISSIRDY